MLVSGVPQSSLNWSSPGKFFFSGTPGQPGFAMASSQAEGLASLVVWGSKFGAVGQRSLLGCPRKLANC